MPYPILDDPEHIKPFDWKARPLGLPFNVRVKDLGWEDPMMKIGRWRLFYYPIRELDPLYYDPIVTNSLIGPGGLEQARTVEMTSREGPSSVSHKEWADRRYFIDPNIKEIYEKYPISQRHPGMGFRPTGLESLLQKKDFLGTNGNSAGLLSIWPGIMPSYWKFFGAPFGEECHVKTAVCARHGLFLGTVYFIHMAGSFYRGRGWQFLLKKWYYYNSITVPIGAAWAAASCISCSLRGKDDAKNMWAGGAAVGALIGLKRGFYRGVTSTILVSLLSTIWYYAINFESGLGLSRHSLAFRENQIITWDPASYKWASYEGKISDKQPLNF